MGSAPNRASTSWWFVKTVRSGARYEDGTLPPEVWMAGGVSPTLNVHDNNSEARATVLMEEGIEGVRRLTPVECERLQDLPDGWTAEGVRDDGTPKAMPDSTRYRQCGNGLTTAIPEWIIAGILELEAAFSSPTCSDAPRSVESEAS